MSKHCFTMACFRHGVQEYEPYTCDGSVDINGDPASKKHTGKWRACYSILGGEFCVSLAYYGVGTNLVSYLTKARKQSNVAAASNVASWQGTCYLTPLLGAFLADSYWGRQRTIVISLAIFTMVVSSAPLHSWPPPQAFTFFVKLICIRMFSSTFFCLQGMLVLTLAAASIHALDISPQGQGQDALPSLGLFLAALGLGGVWPCVPTFGADQFDDTDGAEKAQKERYYNWYYFAVNGGSLASTLLVYVQDSWGWGWGFGIPALFSVVGIAGFLASTKLYRYQKPGGSALTRVCQVVVAAVRKAHVDVPSDSSLLYEVPGKEAAAVVGSRKLVHTQGLRYGTCSGFESFLIFILSTEWENKTK